MQVNILIQEKKKSSSKLKVDLDNRTKILTFTME